jgi:hypothetical protein
MISPVSSYSIIEFLQRDLPGIAAVNTTLKEFDAKSAFSWHLSVLIHCVELTHNRLPSSDEQKVLYDFEDRLDRVIKGDDNALFLARVTHDARRELIWRVRDPAVPNSALQEIIRTKDHPRPIDYRMEEDQQWQKASWYLDNPTSGGEGTTVLR